MRRILAAIAADLDAPSVSRNDLRAGILAAAVILLILFLGSLDGIG